ncbi:hypothetical protein ColTof3_14732 [Colletotrichum tofieldiae]|nr:hypothetical protein ColTof3_14732 [Colletotrichum tofieldiae]
MVDGTQIRVEFVYCRKSNDVPGYLANSAQVAPEDPRRLLALMLADVQEQRRISSAAALHFSSLP